MQRAIWLGMCLVSASLAVVGCKEPEGLTPKMAELAPAQAQLAIGFRLAPLRDSPISGLLGAAAQSDPDFAAMVTAVERCELAVDTMRASLSVSLEGEGEDVFAIIEAPGIGKTDMLECIEKEGAKALGKTPGNLLLRTHGPVRVGPMEGGGSLVQFNDDAVGLVIGKWETAVLERIEKAEARTDTDLGAAIAVAGTDADLWVAVHADETIRADMADFAGADALSQITIEVRTGDVWKANAGLWFQSAEKAEAFHASVAPMKEDLAAAGKEAGMPAATMDSLAIERDDRTVRASLAIPGAELAALAPMVGELMQ